MSKINNVITEVYTNRIKTVGFTDERDPDDFYIVIPVSISKNNTTILNKIKYIEVSFLNNSNFSSFFTNKFLESTSNFKKYNSNENFNEIFKNDIRKNIFLDYMPTYSNQSTNTYNKIIDFSIDNFLSDSFIYNINLSKATSKLILEHSENIETSLNNIRVTLLDKDKNLIDNSDFVFVENYFSSHVNIGIKYYENSYKEYSDSLRLFRETSGINQLDTLKIGNTNQFTGSIYNFFVDFEFIEKVNIEISFINKNRKLRKTSRVISGMYGSKNLNLNFNETSEGFVAFFESIALEYTNNAQIFDFDIRLEVFLNSISSRNTISFNKVISFNRENEFIVNAYNDFINTAINTVMNNIIDSKDSIREKDKVHLKIKFNPRMSENYLNSIVINNIKRNDKELEYIYKNPTFSIDNRIDYKGLTLSEVLESGSLNFWQSLNQEDIELSFEFQIGSSVRVVNISKINEKISFDISQYSNKINTLNRLFKENILFDEPIVSFSLDERTKSIFSYNKMILQNIEYFKDLAFNFGYVDNNNVGDVLRFFEGCVLKIENTTQLNQDYYYNTNYIFLNQLFELNSVNNNSIEARQTFLKNTIENDDLSFVSNRNNTQENYKDFFLSNIKQKIFSLTTNLSDILVKNKLSISLLPISYLILKNAKIGIDDNGQPKIADSDEFKNVMFDLVNMFFGNNMSFSATNFDSFLRTIFSESYEENLIAENFSIIFDFLVIPQTEERNFFKKECCYDKNSIVNILNNRNNIPDFIMRSSTRNMSNYKDISISEEEVKLLNFPYRVNFINSSYNNTLSAYTPRKIKFVKDNEEQISLNFEDLERFLPRETDYYYHSSMQILVTSLEGTISEEVRNNLNGRYFVSNKNGIDFISYNVPTLFNSESDINNTYSLNVNSTEIIDFFDFCKSYNLNFIEDIVVRFAISFSYFENSCLTFFNYKMPLINLNNQKITIDNIREIEIES